MDEVRSKTRNNSFYGVEGLVIKTVGRKVSEEEEVRRNEYVGGRK